MKTILQTIAHWTPAAICAFISLIALYADSSAGKLAFFCLLPFCFFSVAVVTTSMHRELRELRKRLSEPVIVCVPALCYFAKGKPPCST